MSGIVALWLTDGGPVAPSVLDRMAAWSAHRFGTAGIAWRSGPAVLGSAATLPPAGEGDLAVAFDGRLDNRDELADALQLSTEGRSEPDAALILRAYRAWGAEAVSRLLGDFAFAIWDGRARRLLCARDVVGLRPLFYVWQPPWFACASEPAALLAHPALRIGICEAMVGEYLACGISSLEETLYADVRRLPPAHVLTVDPAGIGRRRYWSVEGLPELRYRTDDDYAEHFRTLLGEAVRCRLRGTARAGIMLSGGVDSSTVAAAAAALRDSGDGVPLTAFAAVFPGLACDESRFAEAAAAACRVPLTSVRPTVTPAAIDADAALFRDFPTYANIAMVDEVRRTAASAGVTVLLTGEGGDEWLGGSRHHHADLLRSGRLVALLRQWRADRRLDALQGTPFPFPRLVRLAVGPQLPPTVRTLLRAALRRPPPQPPGWLDRSFASRVDLMARLRTAVPRLPGESYARAHIRATLARATDVHYQEVAERSAARFGLEERHPFHDRRLIEFAVALPERQRWRGLWTKFVLRHAMRGQLPESVRGRLTKSYFSHVYADVLLAAGGARYVTSLHPWLAERLDLAETRNCFRRLEARARAGDGRYTEDIWPSWMIFAIDRWLHVGAPAGGGASAEGGGVG